MTEERVTQELTEHKNTGATTHGVSPANDSTAARNTALRARIQALRGKYPRLRGSVDELINERHAEAMRDM